MTYSNESTLWNVWIWVNGNFLSHQQLHGITHTNAVTMRDRSMSDKYNLLCTQYTFIVRYNGQVWNADNTIEMPIITFSTWLWMWAESRKISHQKIVKAATNILDTIQWSQNTHQNQQQQQKWHKIGICLIFFFSLSPSFIDFAYMNTFDQEFTYMIVFQTISYALSPEKKIYKEKKTFKAIKLTDNW